MCLSCMLCKIPLSLSSQIKEKLRRDRFTLYILIKLDLYLHSLNLQCIVDTHVVCLRQILETILRENSHWRQYEFCLSKSFMIWLFVFRMGITVFYSEHSFGLKVPWLTWFSISVWQLYWQTSSIVGFIFIPTWTFGLLQVIITISSLLS